VNYSIPVKPENAISASLVHSCFGNSGDRTDRITELLSPVLAGLALTHLDRWFNVVRQMGSIIGLSERDLMADSESLLEKTLVVTNQLGLHARVATMMVQTLRNYSSQVHIVKDGVEVNARSVLGLLLLAATPGSEIVVRAQGPDSTEAVQEISRLVQNETPEES
jgi:phosphocarrier protein HPr